MSNSKMEVPTEPEEDHLEVDKPIQGQNFCCVSFLSPEKVLKKKEEFVFYNYYKCKMTEHIDRLKSNMEALLKKVEDGKVKVADVVHLKKNMDKGFNMDLPTFDEWKEKYEDFLFVKGEEVAKVFDEGNKFQTSVRGVKVRGTYDTYREAEVRAKVLQKLDPLFDVFVGQVGYWLAWSPDSNLMENQEHANEELNSLMKGKKDNAAQRDMFYEERKREMKEAAAKENAERKKKLEQEKAEEEKALNSSEQKPQAPIQRSDSQEEEMNVVDNEELTKLLNSNQDNLDLNDADNEKKLNETIDSLQESDPWMARKNADN